MKFKYNYGSKILNEAYEKFFEGEHLTYEEFVIMLSTNDELYFMYDEKEYQVEHTGKDIVHMCVTRYEDNKEILERYEKFSSIIELLNNFKINGKSLYEIWPNVHFTKSR